MSHFDNPPILQEKQERPRIKSQILQILDRHKTEQSEQALTQVKGLNEDELQNILNEASQAVMSDPHYLEYYLGGNFLSETNVPRERQILSLMKEPYISQYPFLTFLCLKEMPKGRELEREMMIHEEIQEAIQKDPKQNLKIPQAIAVIKPADIPKCGIILERLPRDTHNNSLKSFLRETRGEKIALRFSDHVGEKITMAYNELHRLGFTHNDIQEGNIYLENIRYKDYQLPKAPGKRRPKIRIIFDADVSLLDFEHAAHTTKLNGDIEKEQEMEQVQKLLDTFTVNAEETSDLEEIVEANDEYFEQQVA